MSKDPFFTDKKILLIDEHDKDQNDRTWCFWSTENYGFNSNKRSWSKISFKDDKSNLTETIAPFSYHHIQAVDFYQEVFEIITKNPNYHFLKAKVTGIISGSNAQVTTDKGQFTAEIVLNSAFEFAFCQRPNVDLWQHFYGLTIRTPKPIFDDQKVTLMDFSVGTNKERVQFGYILPFKGNEALIEYTEFSENIMSVEEYKKEILQQIELLGIADYEVVDCEMGKIPMTELPAAKNENRIIHLGMSAGLTKPTTGYTFRNIQHDSFEIIESMKTQRSPARPSRKQRFKFYDSLLLGIIKDQPHQVKRIMSSLFRKNKFYNILRFLDESSSLLDEIRIFLSIPWGPFLRQLIKR